MTSTRPCSVVEFTAPTGTGRLYVEGDGPFRVALGHGAGGGNGTASGTAIGTTRGVGSPDLLAARDAALALGGQVVRLEQPWLVRGRRVAEAPARLDEAWTAGLSVLPERPLVVGGRSAGARVACRTADALGAVGVLCLAFPLRPPGRTADRGAELDGPAAPRLVVQGARDPFGVPAAAPGLDVVVVAGADHAFRVRLKDGRAPDDVVAEVRDAVQAWLSRLLPQLSSPPAPAQPFSPGGASP